MTIVTTLVERSSDGYLPAILSDGNTYGLATSRDKITELWSLLEYYYSIEETRDKFLKSKGISDKRTLSQVGPVFTSYMTQARNFYTYAQNSDYRSAALLYYYAFLNLAKAKLVIEKPEFARKTFVHGIKRKVADGGLDKISSVIDKARAKDKVATFDELYKLRFNKSLASTQSFKISNLLGYSSDVSHEYTLVTNEPDKTARVKYLICIDSNRKKCWVKLAIYDWGKFKEYQKCFATFLAEFQQVSISSISREHAFKIPPHAVDWYAFFESKIEFDFLGETSIDTYSCADQLKRVFNNRYQEEVYDQATSFILNQPLRRNLQIPFDELTSIYAAMHHLSEIVRYEPYYLEVLLSNKSKEGWLLKNFIESSPATFLIRMTSWITGNNYYVIPR